MSSKIISEAAIAKDSIALEAFDQTAEMLALGIVNAIVFSSPQAIFLFGGLANSGDLLIKPLKKYVNEYILPAFKDTFEILPSAIPENNAALLGAAALAWKEIS